MSWCKLTLQPLIMCKASRRPKITSKCLATAKFLLGDIPCSCRDPESFQHAAMPACLTKVPRVSRATPPGTNSRNHCSFCWNGVRSGHDAGLLENMLECWNDFENVQMDGVVEGRSGRLTHPCNFLTSDEHEHTDPRAVSTTLRDFCETCWHGGMLE